MENGLSLCVLVVTLVAFTGGALADNGGGNIVLSSVSREVDLTTPLVQQKVTMVIENKGSSAVTQFSYSVDPSLSSKTSYLSAKVSSN